MKIKKSQKLKITHYTDGFNFLNSMTVYTTRGQYNKILDYYTCEAVKAALENLDQNGGVGISFQHKQLKIQVNLMS